MPTLFGCCCRRKEPIIAIGGGVCLDIAGLVSNLYRRNTPVIKAGSYLPVSLTLDFILLETFPRCITLEAGIRKEYSVLASIPPS